MTDDNQDNRSDASGNERPPKKSLRWVGYTLAVIGIPLLLIALLLPALRPAHDVGRRSQCKNNLKQLCIAMHNYHDKYRVFPPAYTVDADGNPLHSWRTLLLPFLDQQALYNQIDLSKPWNDPANKKAYESVPDVYRCPSAVMPDNRTTYMVIVAPGSLFGATESKSIRDVKDGAANTLMVIEVPLKNSVHWMEPKDADERMVLSIRTDKKLSHEGGIQAVLADGAVRFISARIPTATLKALITADGGEEVPSY